MNGIINNRIRIALQKSGRLSEESFSLLERCGIKIKKNSGQLFCHSENFPLDVLLVRDDDILNLIKDGICDLGIVGTNVLEEQSLQHYNTNSNNRSSTNIVLKLNFGSCRLAIAVPDTFSYRDIHSLNHKRIATTYPYLLQRFLLAKQITAKIVVLTGAVEIAPRLNIADAVCDLISTGATLEANGLHEVEPFFYSQAVLIKTTTLFPPEKETTFNLLKQRMDSVLQAADAKYIMLHAPKVTLKEIVKLIPGAENPTIMTLEGNEQLVAVHAVCKENVFWETVEKLKMAGASAILVLPIEKMMH